MRVACQMILELFLAQCVSQTSYRIILIMVETHNAACLNIFVYLIYIVILAPLSPHKRQNPSDQELGFLAGKSLKRQGDGGN